MKKQEQTNAKGTSRTSSQGREESSGGGGAKKGNPETHKNTKARKI